MTTAIEPQREMGTSTEPVVLAELSPKLSARWALAPWHLVAVAAWCLFAYTLNCIPLRQTDLWGHVAYGEWILQHRALPAEDPFVPAFAGMRVIDTAWGAQVLYALVQRAGGGEALSALFAATKLAAYLLLARAFFLQTRSLLVSQLVVVLTLAVGWSRLTTIRPENFGELGFAVLLWLIVSSGLGLRTAGTSRRAGRERPWRFWVGIPVLMGLWANIHGSFVCGFLCLGCFLAGEIVETAWATRSLRAVLADRRVQAWVLVSELALLASFLNPYGIDLLLQTTLFADNENLREISEWAPLVLLDVGGREFTVSAVVFMLLLRHSRRRIPVAHVLLLLLFAASVVRGVRMLWWYGACYGLAVAPHVDDIWRRLRRRRSRRGGAARLTPPAILGEFLRQRSWRVSLVGLLLVWIAVALSPAGRSCLGDKPRPPERLLADATPVKLTKYLWDNPPQGLVFNPQWWGDWLVWDGPPDMKLFMTTNMHLAPRQLWRDYRVVRETRAGWQNVLARHNVRTAILHKQEQTVLLSYLRISREWRCVYEDEMAAVFTRRSALRVSEG